MNDDDVSRASNDAARSNRYFETLVAQACQLPTKTPDYIDTTFDEIHEARRRTNTAIAYASDSRAYADYCADTNIRSPYAITPKQWYGFAAWGMRVRGWKLSSATRRMCGARHEFKVAGVAHPVAYRDEKRFLASFRTKLAHGNARARARIDVSRKRALDKDLYYELLSTFDATTPLGARNHALISNQFAGMFRSSEITGLHRRDRQEYPQGHVLTLHHSKTNQNGTKEHVRIRMSAVPQHCPVRSMDRWLRMLSVDGPIFPRIDRWGHISDEPITPEAVTYIMKRALRELGIPEDEIQMFASHSARRSGITWRIKAKKARTNVMQEARIARSTTLDVYIDDVDPWYDVPEDSIL